MSSSSLFPKKKPNAGETFA
jgi:hypothetical protein